VSGKEDKMNSTIFQFPAPGRAPLSCVWIATGDAAQPLACRWIVRRRLQTRELSAPLNHEGLSISA
jgi:hypothetical protein